MVTLELEKQEWIDQYAGRIMDNWHIWHGPFGIDDQYKNVLKQQLASYFADPLKRSLIETTY